MELKKILREKRKQNSWTQEELAEKLSVTSKTVSNWETGKTFPDIESLIRISKLYQLSLDNLLTEGSDVVILNFFNREVRQEERVSEISIHPNKRTKGLLLFVVLFLGAVIWGYLMKH